MKNNPKKPSLPDLNLDILHIKEQDFTVRKMMMLIEGVYGLGVRHSLDKYGYTEQRYYQLLKNFQQLGLDALIDQKRGPKQNSLRTEKVMQQIIRHRFLDPDANAAVIAQKLHQTGMTVSLRSVERTIQEYGLQKKTLSVKPG